MKKTFIYVIVALFATSFVAAQEFSSGTNVINAGIGLGGQFDTYGSPSQSPTFSASYERGIWDIAGPGVISLGGYLGHKSYKYSNNDKWNYTIVGVRGAYHYTGLNVENLDVYGGAMLSYNILSYDNSYSASGAYDSELGASLYVGGRWYFTEVFGVFAELGYGVANVNLGVAFRF